MTGTVERAFELAPSCRTVEELRSKLTNECFSSVDAHISGSLRIQLKKLLKAGT
jgi:hypothetical protein